VCLSADGNAALPNAAEVKLADSNKEDQRMRSALEADGWTVLAMETDLYKPGQLFRAGSTVPEASGCMDAKPISGSFKTTASEGSSGFVVSGGADLGRFGAGASVNAKTFKLKSISDTTTDVIETIDFELNDRCTKYLEKLQARGMDLTGWVVIQQTLSARVKEVTCTGQEAALKVQALWVARTELGEMSGCTQSSDVTGVIAYKTRLVSELWAAAAPAPVVVAGPPAPPVADDKSWAKSLLDWDSCSFGYLEDLYQEGGLSGERGIASPVSLLPLAKKLASSSTARKYLAEYGGRAFKSCDRAEWTNACRQMRARLADYKAIRSDLSCSFDCEPLDQPKWGLEQQTYAEGGPGECENSGCKSDYYDWRIDAYLLKKYGELEWAEEYLRRSQIKTIHRQTLRGIGTMEMNKLINTFCD
jgi:hypothetical protein